MRDLRIVATTTAAIACLAAVGDWIFALAGHPFFNADDILYTITVTAAVLILVAIALLYIADLRADNAQLRADIAELRGEVSRIPAVTASNVRAAMESALAEARSDGDAEGYLRGLGRRNDRNVTHLPRRNV